MASTALFTNDILGAFLDTLERETVLQRLIWRDVERDFTGSVGRTVNLRKPQVRTAASAAVGPQNHQGTVGVGGPFDATAFPALTSVEGNDSYIPVTINERVYDRQPLSDYAETMDLEDYTLQFLAPMVRAVSRGLEDEIADLMDGATYPAANQYTINLGAGAGDINNATPEDFVDAIADFSVRLDEVLLPGTDRFLVVGNDYARQLLKAPSVKQADRAGSDTQLRSATLLEHYGFTVVRSQAIAAGKAYAFHPSAYIMAVRAPVVPTSGPIEAASMANDEFAMTMVRDWVQDSQNQDVVVSSFVGTTVNLDPGLQDTAATNPAGTPTFLRAIEIDVVNTA